MTFYISFATSARKTALILRTVFNISVSYQTVLNYAEAAAHYCHQFNLKNKGPLGSRQAGDEAYIKVRGKDKFAFFFISPKRHKITAYHVADSRETRCGNLAFKRLFRHSLRSFLATTQDSLVHPFTHKTFDSIIQSYQFDLAATK